MAGPILGPGTKAVTITFGISELQAAAQGNGFTGGTQVGSDVIGLTNGGYAVAFHNPDGTGDENFPIFSLRNSAFVQTVGLGIPYGPGAWT